MILINCGKNVLKSGLVTLEKSVEKVIQSNHYVADLLERKSKDIDQKIESLESMYDNKLTVFMNAVSTDCQDMTTKNSILIKDDILCQKKNISKIESRFHKSVNQIQKDMNNNKCECTDNLPKWTDFDMLKKNRFRPTVRS